MSDSEGPGLVTVALRCASCGESFGEYPVGPSLVHALHVWAGKGVRFEHGFCACAPCWAAIARTLRAGGTVEELLHESIEAVAKTKRRARLRVIEGGGATCSRAGTGRRRSENSPAPAPVSEATVEMVATWKDVIP